MTIGDEETLKALVGIIEKARVRQRRKRAREERITFGTPEAVGKPARALPIDGAALASELADLFAAMGIATVGAEDTKLWREVATETSNHKTLADGFQRMSRAKDPLSKDLCVGEYRLALKGKVALHWSGKARRPGRNAPPSLDLLKWEELSNEEKSQISAMCRDLEAYHRSFVRQARPTKNDLNTALLELAERFARYRDEDQTADHDDYAPMGLPHSEDSHFIQFCCAALAAYSGKGGAFDPSQVTSKALSERWVRLKRAYRKPKLLRFDVSSRRVSNKRKKPQKRT
jgi:hypothetical protein